MQYLSVTRCVATSFSLLSGRALTTSSAIWSHQSPVLSEDEEFRVLVIPGHTKVEEVKKETVKTRRQVPPPRYKSMSVDQDWTNVWPAAHTFKWSAVPFPVRQGFVEHSENDGIPPSKYANAELMKIPNFLHLTPNHVKKHCDALKHLCTKWPVGLETDEDCDTHFPLTVSTRDYLADGVSVRDERARKATIRVKLSTLKLDDHARDKFLRLTGARYNKETDILTLEMDRCPTKKQNYDHGMYVLTALYYESWKTEKWEAEKTLADMEKYVWDINESKTKILKLLKDRKQKAASDSVPNNVAHLPDCLQTLSKDATDDQLLRLPDVVEYKEAVTELLNDGETVDALKRYKDAVKRLLLSPSPPSS